MLRFRKYPSLRRVILRNLIPLAIIPLVLLTLSICMISSEHMRQQIIEDDAVIVQSIEREIADFTQNAKRSLEAIGEKLLAASEKGEGAEAYLKTIFRVVPYFELIAFLDNSGTVVYSVPEELDLIGNNFTGSDFMTALFTGAADYYSESFISPFTRLPTIIYALPMGGGYLMCHLNLAFLKTISQDTGRYGNLTFILTDHRGTVIASENQELVLQRRNLKSLFELQAGAAEGADVFWLEDRGEKFLAYLVTEKIMGWSILILHPRTEAFFHNHQILLSSLIIMLILIPAIIVSSLILGSKLAKPIEELTEETERISSGYYRFRSKGWYREFNTLVNTLQQMASNIENREEIIRQSEKKYKELVENAQSMIIRWDKSKRMLYYNDYAAEVFGLDKSGKDAGNPLSLILPENEADLPDRVWKNPDLFTYYQNANITRSGELLWVQWRNRIVNGEDGAEAEILSVGSDITEIRNSQEKISKTLREKEVLLQEVHHRVKNNLQVIISLLELKWAGLADSREKQSIRESINHIYSIASVYEQAHTFENITKISLEAYLRDILANLYEL